jgi:hypothetical protein
VKLRERRGRVMLAEKGEKCERKSASTALSLQMVYCPFIHLNTFQNYVRIFTKFTPTNMLFGTLVK